MKSQNVPYQSILSVCTNVRSDGRIACANQGRCGAGIREALKAEVKARGLEKQVRVCSSGCMDLCVQGPNVMAFTREGKQVWHGRVSESDLPLLLEQYFPRKDA